MLSGADPALVSDRAYERGYSQLGTLGSGNHFAELQYVSEIYDEAVASAFGLRLDQVTAMIHSGSRGLGHQVCEDHLRIMIKAAATYGIELPDRQLCCAPVRSPEGRAYLAAMSAAANYAFANRQVMAHWVRESIADAMGITSEATQIRTIYDVCHNIAKMEEFPIAPAKAGALDKLPSDSFEEFTEGGLQRGRASARLVPATHTCWWARTVRTSKHSDQPVTGRGGAGAGPTRSARPRGARSYRSSKRAVWSSGPQA